MAKETTTAPPLTVDNVLTAVQGANWRTLGKRLYPSHQYSYPKLDEIEQQYKLDADRLHALVKCWVHGNGKDREPSWRRVIYELDCANQSTIADNIRHFAEAVTDPSLSVEKVLEVMGEVRDWERLGDRLEIPDSQLAEIMTKSSTEEEKCRTLGQYWVKTAPNVSWERLAWTLYYSGEEIAAAMANQYLPKDPTLTLEKVTEVMEEVGDWESVGSRLDIPKSKLVEIKQQSSTEAEKRCALGEFWVRTAPNSSWERLATALNVKGEESAAAITKQYLPNADPTLTIDNLMEVVKEVEDRWEVLGYWLGVQWSKRQDIKSLYRSDHQRMKAMVVEYVKYNLSPSWKEVAVALQKLELNKLVDEVTSKYVKVSEKAKILFDEAMTHGYVEARDIKALIFGAAGTGKSHTIALIMDEHPPAVRRSTPCATRPVRAVSRTRAEKRGKKWVRVTHDELAQSIADTSTLLPAKPPSASNAKTSAVSFSTSAVADTSSTPTLAGNSKPQTGHQQHMMTSPPSTKGYTSTSSVTHENLSSVSTCAEDELLRRIEMSSYRRYAKSFKRDRISLIDTGGQPHFHEVLPIFMRDTSATMFVIKLNESLGDHPLIEYFDDSGQRVGIPYLSAYTNEQILRHCMMVMQSQASQSQEGLCPSAIFIGTHKDLEDQCSESREEKNLKIRDMLLPAIQNDVIYYGEDLKELIFPVNVKTPGPQEREFAAEIRRVIVERSHVKPKQIPLQWYALELALQKLMLEQGRGVLSKVECLAVAQRYFFDDESFEEALKYLDDLNILFYYKDVLPDIIFCDSQVLLEKISELVEHIHRLKTDPRQCKAAEGKLRRFRDQGILTLELLSKREFSKHYVPGLFGPVQLLKLFAKLLIVSQITEEEYLMPCLLPVTEEPPLSNSVPPLVFYFPDSVLVGVFCALMAYLLSQAKWKLLFDPHSRSPAKVSRNTIQFTVPGGLPGKVVLADSFSNYLQVGVQLPESVPVALYSTVCPEIRETIMAGLHKACHTLHYNCVFQDAFLCPRHSVSTPIPHATIVDSSRTLMVCTLNPAEVCSTLEEQHLLWFGSSPTSDIPHSDGSQPSFKICSPSGYEDMKPRIAQLMRLNTTKGKRVNIMEAIAPVWKKVGLLMDLDPIGRKVERIEAEHAHKWNGLDICCQEIFKLWLESPDATWGNLIKLLTDSEEGELAKQVKDALEL